MFTCCNLSYYLPLILNIIIFFYILDINHSFVIERRVQRNSRFSRAFFKNGESLTSNTTRVIRDMISCVNDTIYLRVSFYFEVMLLYVCDG